MVKPFKYVEEKCKASSILQCIEMKYNIADGLIDMPILPACMSLLLKKLPLARHTDGLGLHQVVNHQV